MQGDSGRPTSDSVRLRATAQSDKHRASVALRNSTGRLLLSPDDWRALTLSLRLSARELQVVQGVFDDLNEAQIGRQLGISSHTVHTYLERLYRKLGVKSRGQLLVRMFSEHLKLMQRAVRRGTVV